MLEYQPIDKPVFLEEICESNQYFNVNMYHDGKALYFWYEDHFYVMPHQVYDSKFCPCQFNWYDD